MQAEPYDILIMAAAEDDLLRLAPRLRVLLERTISRLAEYTGPHSMLPWLRPLEGRPGGYRIELFEYYVLLAIDEDARVIRVARILRRREWEQGRP